MRDGTEGELFGCTEGMSATDMDASRKAFADSEATNMVAATNLLAEIARILSPEIGLEAKAWSDGYCVAMVGYGHSLYSVAEATALVDAHPELGIPSSTL